MLMIALLAPPLQPLPCTYYGNRYILFAPMQCTQVQPRQNIGKPEQLRLTNGTPRSGTSSELSETTSATSSPPKASESKDRQPKPYTSLYSRTGFISVAVLETYIAANIPNSKYPHNRSPPNPVSTPNSKTPIPHTSTSPNTSSTQSNQGVYATWARSSLYVNEILPVIVSSLYV